MNDVIKIDTISVSSLVVLLPSSLHFRLICTITKKNYPKCYRPIRSVNSLELVNIRSILVFVFAVRSRRANKINNFSLVFCCDFLFRFVFVPFLWSSNGIDAPCFLISSVHQSTFAFLCQTRTNSWRIRPKVWKVNEIFGRHIVLFTVFMTTKLQTRIHRS